MKRRRGADRTPPPATPSSSTVVLFADLLVTPCCTDATCAHATTADAKSLRAHRREGATSSVSLDTSAGSPSQTDGIGFASSAWWSAPAGMDNSEEGRTHDARTQKPDRLAEPHCGRTAGRGVYRPAESQHGAEPPGLLGRATPGPVPHGEVDGRWAHRSPPQPRYAG